MPDGRDRRGVITGIILAGLAMSVGWGFRGDYGHEAGAMVPGALLGLAICIGSGRADWGGRGAIMGACGAIGWAFGGQMSYGQIIGYTAASSPLDVFYGYACLFLIGGLWAGVGSAVLAQSVTQSRSYLEQFARPLIVLGLVWSLLHVTGVAGRLADTWSLHDTDWVGALSALAVGGVCALLFPRDRGACAMIAVLAAGWWVGYLVLVQLFGLHMTPPRSDNWAGSVGLFIALLAWLIMRRDGAAVMLAGWGFVAGGAGFVFGDFLNMLGRAQWGPIGRYEVLHDLDYWKWMEQSFGLIMGLGVGAAFLLHVRSRLPAPPEDSAGKRLHVLSLMLLLVVMMWLNLSKNVSTWLQGRHIPQSVLGIDSSGGFFAIGVLLAAMATVAIIGQHRGLFTIGPASDSARARMLFLLVLWIAILGAFTKALPGLSSRGTLVVQASFLVTAALCSSIVIVLRRSPRPSPDKTPESADLAWRMGWKFWVCLALVPVFLYIATCLTVGSHDGPLPGSHTRFTPSISARP